jgi:hypothetical protein
MFIASTRTEATSRCAGCAAALACGERDAASPLHLKAATLCDLVHFGQRSENATVKLDEFSMALRCSEFDGGAEN